MHLRIVVADLAIPPSSHDLEVFSQGVGQAAPPRSSA
jgi:hypothetical protein